MSDKPKPPPLLDALLYAVQLLTLYGADHAMAAARRLDQEAKRVSLDMARAERRREISKQMDKLGYSKAEKRAEFKRRAKERKEFRAWQKKAEKSSV